MVLNVCLAGACVAGGCCGAADRVMASGQQGWDDAE